MTATSQGDETPVLIVGAGPTGLIIAIELARRGIPFHIVDRNKEPTHWSAATVIKARTLEILSALGVLDRFFEHGQIIDGVDLYLEGDKAGAFQLDTVDSPWPHILSIPEDMTIELLTERLEELSGTVERGVEFVGLQDTGDHVQVRLRSDVKGDHVLNAQWVVGTDGYRSAVRRAIGDGYDGRDYPELWGVVDSDIDEWHQPTNRICAQLQPPNVIAIPVSDTRHRIYFRPDRADESALDDVVTRLRLVSKDASLANVGEPQFFHSHSKLAQRYRIGRVFLAGDAAHASNPIEGHGMNAGIHDAYNLGWKLALAVSGAATDALLDSYEAERKKVDREIVQSGDDAYVRMDPAHDRERRDLIDFLATQEGQKFAAMAESEIGFVYDESPIVEDHGIDAGTSPDRVAAGTRVGDVDGLENGAGNQNLYGLVDGLSHSLLVLLGDAKPPAVADALDGVAAVRNRHGPILDRAHVVINSDADTQALPEGVLRDASGHLHRQLGGSGPTICLIRPDGHLGFRCGEASWQRLNDHLDRLHGAG